MSTIEKIAVAAGILFLIFFLRYAWKTEEAKAPPGGHVEVCEPALCPPPTKAECPESVHHTTYLCREYQCRRFHDDHVEGAVGEPVGTIICKYWLVWCGEE